MKLFEFLENHMLNHLLQLCKEELDLQDFPPIQIISDEYTVGYGTSFGQFDGENIQVASKGRHPMDVMRTLAHELVHWKQRVNGEELDGSDGSSTENDANAIAGVIMRKFGQKYPDYFINTIP